MARQAPTCSVTVPISRELLEDPRYDVPAILKAMLEERLSQKIVELAQREHELQARGSAAVCEPVGFPVATEAT